MTLADLILDEAASEETRNAVACCIRISMMSAITVFLDMTIADASNDEMAKTLAETERLCVEETLARVHCRVIGKPRVKPSSN